MKKKKYVGLCMVGRPISMYGRHMCVCMYMYVFMYVCRPIYVCRPMYCMYVCMYVCM